MKFQAGDHVLLDGRCYVIGAVGGHTILLIEKLKELNFGVIVDFETLTSHQIPWSFDKNLNGWVPA